LMVCFLKRMEVNGLQLVSERNAMTYFSIRACGSSMEALLSGRTWPPVERPNMLSRSAAKLWAIELDGSVSLELRHCKGVLRTTRDVGVWSWT
jgi:hypothetical protein